MLVTWGGDWSWRRSGSVFSFSAAYHESDAQARGNIEGVSIAGDGGSWPVLPRWRFELVRKTLTRPLPRERVKP